MGQSDTELEEHFFSFLFVSILKWPRTRWPWAVAAAGSISCNTWPLISPLSFSKFTSPGGGRRDFLPQHTHTHGSHWPSAMYLSSSSRSMFQCFLVPKHVCEPLLSQVPGHGLDWFDSNCSSFDRADTGEHFSTKLDRFWLYWAELFRPESGDSFNTRWSKGFVSFNSFTAKLFKLNWWNKHQFVAGIVGYRLICKLISSISNEWKILIFKSA